MKEIELTKGRRALVDDCDYGQLIKTPWHYSSDGYAVYRPRRRPIIRMHRLILDAPKGVHVDHINGDRLDNRRQNLRLSTISQNAMNRNATKFNRCGFKGVYFSLRHGKFVARIGLNNKDIHLGYFASAIEAATAYNFAAIKYHGAFARLNEIK